MSESVIVALLSCAGTVIGAFIGIMTSTKLSNYRIAELEKKLDTLERKYDRIHVIERDLGTCFTKYDALKQNVDGIRKELR